MTTTKIFTPNIAFSEVIARYTKSYLKVYRKSISSDVCRLRRMATALGESPTVEGLEEYLSTMRGSASTRNRYRAVIKHMLRRYPDLITPSVRYGSFQFPRCLSLEPELNQRDVRLTEQQERDLITHMGDDLRALFIMACDTGLRRGSLCQLRAKHINLKSRTIIVPASIQKQKRTQKLPMTDRVYSLLEVRLSKGGVRKPLFKWNQYAWDQARKKAETPSIRWHDLRHEFGSRLLDEKGPLPTIQRLLGHRQITTTMRYLNTTDVEDEDRAAISRLV